MHPLLEKTKKYIGIELRMPWWLFWSILLSITWFYIVRRVISWDLWWHMAAGRYTLENGCYPETGTFTYSPVKDTHFTSLTWFGDIILHLTYDWFGFYGLQILRGTFILSGVLFMLHLVKFRYNVWTLLISSMMIIGTMQKHLIKNAIIVLPAMSFIAWSWIQIKYHKRYYLIFAYPILFFIWRPFHGSVMVGASFLFAILAGEVLDFIISHIREYLHTITLKKFFTGNIQYIAYSVLLGLFLVFRFHMTIALIGIAILIVIYTIAYFTHPDPENLLDSIKKDRTPVKQLGIIIAILSFCMIYTHAIYQLPMLKPFNPVFQAVGILPKPKIQPTEEAGVVVATKAKAKSKTHEEMFFEFVDHMSDESKSMKARLKSVFRIFFGGTDARLVAEYQWPFEILYVLSVKSLFLMVVIFACYLIFRVSIGAFDFKLSMELPNLALIYLSMGYLRTLSYPFVSAVIFFTFSFFYCLPYLRKGNKALKGWIVLGLSFFLLILWAQEPLFEEFVNLFFNALKDPNITEKDARFLAIPILLMPIAIGLIMIIKNSKIFENAISILMTCVGVYTLVCLLIFSRYENKTYQDGDFHTVTGFLDTEPGLGKSSKFFDGMADIVQAELPPKNIYNTYNMGGYLLWKWYLERQVFIDGRSAIYETNFYKAYTSNNAAEYIKKEDLEHAILNMVVDKDRIMLFAKQGWYPIHFDPGMTIMKKPKTYEEPFGKLPKYHEGERAIEDLANLDRANLAEFINVTVHHMMLYGRMKDAYDFMTNHQDLIAKLPKSKDRLNQRLDHLNRIGKMFGHHNHRAMGPLAQQLFKNVQGAEHQYAIAEAFYGLKKYPQAEAHFAQAYKMEQQKNKDKKVSLKVLKRLGESLFLNKKYNDALVILNQALQASPKDATLHNLMVLPLIELKKLDQALQFGKQAYSLNPKFAEAYFNVGRVYLMKQNGDHAIAHFQKALQLKPNFPEAQNVMKQLQAQFIQQQKAAQSQKDAAQKAQQTTPQAPKPQSPPTKPQDPPAAPQPAPTTPKQ